MGTRNLTIVQLEGAYRVAQYGQWDGYPSVAGARVLAFLKTCEMQQFKKKLMTLSFLTDKELEAIEADEDWLSKRPQLSRDHGSRILDYIMTKAPPGLKLANAIKFAADSLFCEWAYVLDLDKNKLEIYKGFNKRKLGKDARFYDLQEADPEGGYYPVRKVKEYSLNELPDVDTLVKDCPDR